MLVARLALAVLLAAALAACGDSDDDGAGTTATAARTATAAQTTPSGATDRGARRCSRAAFLAALLADVARAPFRVDRVRCRGDYARTRFRNAACGAGQGSTIACDRAQVAAWQLGERRWRLIAYMPSLSCTEVRKRIADYPSDLCD